MPTIDNLQIDINAQATRANDAVDRLAEKLDRLTTSLSRVEGSKLTGLANGVQKLGNAMQTMGNVKTTEFSRLARNLKNLSTIDTAAINRASSSVTLIAKSFRGLNGLSKSAEQLGQLANGIKQLGYKSAGQAIDNIPKLAAAMRQLMNELSKAPRVSQNLIDMTNALAKLSRTGASSGRAANSIAKSLDTYTASTHRASKGSFSLASAIGKVYASYWLLLRAFGGIRKAIDISSDLTEVQNVVDVTFGDMSSKVEEFAQNSIQNLGMSELSVKSFASRFQAMGMAMGIDPSLIGSANKYLSGVTDGYVGLSDSMADVSLNLTKLTADMASFYNVEQAVAAEDLAAIFTGETRPLRDYGIDLTQATLAEWAMKQGMDANIQSMSQAEKTMLRYQYVMANTGAAQRDFIRTQDTWANQVRILKEQIRQLASVIGGVFINALKPLVKALNVAMSYIIEFAKTISNALGKIFGWQYEVGGGGMTQDFAGAAGSAEDIADSTGQAADNIKKMQAGLRAFDELKVINMPEAGGGNGGAGGGGGGAAGGGASGGQWVKGESMLENFESEIDTLFELGEYIGKTLTDAMNSIDWKKVYEGAKNFGKGLADFLNGLISPDLFGAVGKTIAGALNTAIYAALSFGETFEFEEFGLSIAEGINQFFETFDFASLAQTINVWVQGIWSTIKTALANINWKNVLKGFYEFFDELDFLPKTIIALKTLPKLLKAITSNKILKGFINIAKALSGNRAAIDSLIISYPKLGKAVNVARKAFANFQFGISNGNIFTGLNEGITTIRNNLTNLQKGAITAVAGFAEFKIVSDVFEGIVDGSENVVAGIAKIGVAVGVAGAAMYTALGPAGLAIAGITGIIAAFKGIEDAEKQLIENSEIEKYGDTISNITERINETSAAIKNRANEAMEYVETAGMAEISMASDLADKYFDLAEKENLTNQEKTEMQNLATALVDTLPSLQDYYNTETGLLDMTRESIDSLIQSRLQEIQLSAIEDKLKEAYEQQYEAISNLEQAIIPANDAQERMNSLNKEYQDIMSKMELLAEYERLSEQINLATGDTEELYEKQKEVWNELTNDGVNAFPTYDSLSQKLGKTTEEMSVFSEKYEETLGALAESKEAYDLVENNISTLTEMFTNGMTQAADNAVEGYANGIESGTELAAEATRLLGEAGIESMEKTQDSHSPSKEYEKLGKYAVDGYNLGFSNNQKSTISTISLFVQMALNRFRELVLPMYNIGLNAMQGLYNGLSSMENSLYKKAQSIANNIANTVKTALDIHSPSRVMAELGEYAIAGLKEGMESLYKPTLESLKGFSYNIEVAPVASLTSMYDSYQPAYESSYSPSYSGIEYLSAVNHQSNVETNTLLREVLNELRKGHTIELDGGIIAGRIRKIANDYTTHQGKPYFDY